MQEDLELDGAERELEAALLSLHPCGASLNRDELLYQAGYRRGKRSARLWQVNSALMLAGLLGLAILRPWSLSPEPIPPVQIGISPPLPPSRDIAPVPIASEPDPRPPFLVGSFAEPASSGASEPALLRRVRMERLLGISPQDVGGQAAYQQIVRRTLGEMEL